MGLPQPQVVLFIRDPVRHRSLQLLVCCFDRLLQTKKPPRKLLKRH